MSSRPRTFLSRPGRWWATVLVAWTALALVSILQTGLELGHHDVAFRWPVLVVRRLLDWYTCAAMLPLLVWTADRFPFQRAAIGRAAGAHLLAGAAAVIGKVLLYAPIVSLASAQPVHVMDWFAGGALTDMAIFWVALAVIHGLNAHGRLQQQQRIAIQLQADLSTARLEALASQLNPHFLFNTLGAISELVHQDPLAADRMITGLSAFLRASLQRGGAHDATVSEELDSASRYVDIMRTRFGDRLQVDLSAVDQSRDALVPALILQPLIENAFEHGVARRRGPASVRVRVTVDDDNGVRTLVMTVLDDGPGPDAESRGTGIGLHNTRRRLQTRYGDEQSFTLEPAEGGGMRARMIVPYLVREHT